MEHKPVEILLKVPCSEGLPKKSGRYLVQMSEDGVKWEADFDAVDKTWKSGFASLNYTVICWYEPATRVVLTVDEFKALLKDKYDQGYDDGYTIGF